MSNMIKFIFVLMLGFVLMMEMVKPAMPMLSGLVLLPRNMV